MCQKTGNDVKNCSHNSSNSQKITAQKVSMEVKNTNTSKLY